MNHLETVQLVRVVASLCPNQKFDEYTPDAWAIVLEDVRYEDAQQAVKDIYRQPLGEQWSRRIEASHILDQVRKTRNAKIDAYGPIDPPPGLDPGQYPAWLRQARTAIANDTPPPKPQLTARPMPNLAEITQRIEP